MISVHFILLPLLLLTGSSLGIYLTDQEAEVIYSELKEMNASCAFDHCFNTSRVFPYSPSMSCDCDPRCSIYDSCCLDSPYRPKRPSGYPGRCVGTYPNKQDHIYMIETCRPGWPFDETKILCRADGERKDDPMLLVPVTSLRTTGTYRNYFCAVCNNDTSNLVSWNVKLIGPTSTLTDESALPDLHFDRNLTRWTVRDDNGTHVVNLSLQMPDELLQVVRRCRYGMIEDCPDNWTDDVVRHRCRSYLSRMYVRSTNTTVNQYQNPHCAVCHGEDLTKMFCNMYGGYGAGGGLKDVMFVGLFVMDDGQKCEGDKIYDKFSKKCRTFRCPSKQKVENGKCVDK